MSHPKPHKLQISLCGDPKPVGVPLRVLVVDDEPGFRNLLEWEFKNRGMNVEVAANGVEGMSKVEQHTFDVIITDITMPEMDGLKLLEAIKARHLDTEIIVATGFSAIETAVYAMRKGAFDFVLKPYDVDHLMKRILQAVDQMSRCRSCGRANHGQD